MALIPWKAICLAACWLGGGLFAPFVLGAAPSPPSLPASAPPTVEDDADAPAIALAETRGHELWLVDQAAWRATDALREADGMEWLPEGAKGRGWITTRLDLGGRHWLVAFLASEQGAPATVWAEVEVRFNERLETDVRRVRPSRTLTSAEAGQRAALDAALATEGRACSEQINTAVLLERDIEDRPRFLVYILSASTSNVVVAGGHERVIVDAESFTVLDRFSQTRACVNIAMPTGGDDIESTPMVSHLTSPTPTEIHVFLSKTFDRSMFVATMANEKLWKVEDGRIREVERPVQGDAPTDRP